MDKEALTLSQKAKVNSIASRASSLLSAAYNKVLLDSKKQISSER